MGVVDEVLSEATAEIMIQSYKAGGIEKLPIQSVFPKKDPTPAIPYVSGFVTLPMNRMLTLFVCSPMLSVSVKTSSKLFCLRPCSTGLG
jgi:hypothetical protein